MKLREHVSSPSIAAALVLVGFGASACRQDMHDQPKYKAAGESQFFADHRNNRPQVPGTVARDHLDENDHFYRGRIDGKLAETYPIAVTAEVLRRGRERYTIYCQPCHSPIGDGNGIAVQRGMKRPPSYHIERLQKSPPGYFFDVISNGFATMYDYSERIRPEDRWAITAYVQTLQQSQNTSTKDLASSEVAQIGKSAPAIEPASGHGATSEHKKE